MKAKIKLSACLFILQHAAVISFSASPMGHPLHNPTTQELTTQTQTPPLNKIDNYEDAVRVIDDCAVKGESNEQLYSAARFMEVNAYKLYPELTAKQALWQRAHGSWKLILSTGSAKCNNFHPPPKFLPFSAAMIDDEHFGNAVGLNDQTIWLSFLHKHYFDTKIRHMVVTVQEFYWRGHRVTDKLPAFLRTKMNLGKAPADFVEKPPPTFVIVAATDKALIARGNQSGGLALWTRMDHDIRPVAYKGYAEQGEMVAN